MTNPPTPKKGKKSFFSKKKSFFSIFLTLRAVHGARNGPHPAPRPTPHRLLGVAASGCDLADPPRDPQQHNTDSSGSPLRATPSRLPLETTTPSQHTCEHTHTHTHARAREQPHTHHTRHHTRARTRVISHTHTRARARAQTATHTTHTRAHARA